MKVYDPKVLADAPEGFPSKDCGGRELRVWSIAGSRLSDLCRTCSLLCAGHTSTQTPQPVQSSGATCTES
jgi:hypothetical protein